MEITFLGTGTSQGVPIIGCDCEVCSSKDPRDKRLRSSIMISLGASNIVVDTGPDFRYQMLREKVKNLDAVVFTHQHKDHVAGLDDVRPFNFLLKKVIDVYAENRVLDSLRREFSYAFEADKYPGVPDITLHAIDCNPFNIGDLRIIPIRAYHHNLPVLGFRMGGFTYITDASRIEVQELDKAKGSDIFVLNALRRKQHISHFTLDEALQIVDYVKPARAYFTHLSHQMGLYRDIMKELPAGVHIAYDGLKLHV